MTLHNRTQAFAIALMVAIIGSSGPAAAWTRTCPSPLGNATRLVLVTTDSMSSLHAKLQTFERRSKLHAWHAKTQPQSAVLGTHGLAWAHPFQSLAAEGEPLKVEGDNRSPAGVFALGATFGFDQGDRAFNIALEKNEHICVDDLASPHYNQIVSRAEAGPTTSAEEMRDITTYRRGIVIDIPTDRALRTGSCIFLHNWSGSDIGTGGCVGLPEASVEALQDWGGSGKAVIAIVPEYARDRMGSCLPDRGGDQSELAPRP